MTSSLIDISRQAADFQHNSSIRYGLILSRVLFFVGIALLIAGGSLEGNYNNESSVMTGLKLVRAGYIIIAVFVGCLLAFQVYFWRRAARLSLTSMTVSNVKKKRHKHEHL